MGKIIVEKPTDEKKNELKIPEQCVNEGLWSVWECDPSTFDWHYDETESCYLLNGEVTVTPEGGEPVHFGAGDFVVFPKGMSCVWQIHQAVKKHYQFG